MSAPSVGVHWNVGCVAITSLSAGVSRLGAIDCFWKVCFAAELTGSPTAPPPFAAVAGSTAQ